MARWLGRAIITCALAGGFAWTAAVQAQPQAPQRGGRLAYANSAGPGTLDPHVAGGLAQLEIVHHLFETLVAMDESHNARPMLAASVEVGNAARRYRFVLRRGVRFHNGAEMNSADVLASFERYAMVSPNGALLADVEGYDTPDPYTFVVRLKRTNAVFLDMLKSPTHPLAILPAGQKDKSAGEADEMGTGPFVLESWDKDRELVLRRNDAYSADRSATGPEGLAGRKTVYLDRVHVRFVPDATERLAALRDGGADVVSTLRPDMAAGLADRGDLATQEVFPFCQLMFVTNAAHGATADVRVRQAIRAVVDVDEIMAETGQVARRNPSLVYPGSPYHSDQASAAFYDRANPGEARALLQQAGYRGEKLVLQTNSTYSYMRDAIQVLGREMRLAGMNAEVEVVDWATNAGNMRRGAGEWNVSVTGFCTQPLLGPQQWRSAIGTYARLRDPTALDAAYERYFNARELAPRQREWLAIEGLVLGEAHFIKLADLGAVRGYNARVAGLRPYFFLRFWNVWLNSGAI